MAEVKQQEAEKDLEAQRQLDAIMAGGRKKKRRRRIIIAVIALAAVLWFIVRPMLMGGRKPAQTGVYGLPCREA